MYFGSAEVDVAVEKTSQGAFFLPVTGPSRSSLAESTQLRSFSTISLQSPLVQLLESHNILLETFCVSYILLCLFFDIAVVYYLF